MPLYETTHVGFLIFPGFPMACLTSMIEPLRAANEIAGKTAFGWQILSEGGQRIEASAHVWFDPDLALEECTAIDKLFILSGPSSHFEKTGPSNGKLRKLARHGTTLGGISGGIFPLARAGLLEGHVTSVHWCYEAAFAAEFPTLKVTEDLIMIDRQRITVSGAAAAFEFSLRLVQDVLGPGVATEVACWFQHPLMRGQEVAQRKPTFDVESTHDMLPTPIRQAVLIFDTHIEDPVTIQDVADQIGVSTRQLERMFHKFTGTSPLDYYRTLRIQKARQLLLYSKESMSDIALAVGYSSTATMIKNYHKVFHVHPREDRNKINMFRVRENAIIPSA